MRADVCGRQTSTTVASRRHKPGEEGVLPETMVSAAAMTAMHGADVDKKAPTGATNDKSKRALRRQRQKQTRQELRAWGNGANHELDRAVAEKQDDSVGIICAGWTRSRPSLNSRFDCEGIPGDGR